MLLKIGDLIQHHVYDGGELPPPNPPGYQYLMAGNGIFIYADSPALTAVQPVSRAHVRWLPDLKPFVQIKHKKMPGKFLRSITDHAQNHLEREVVYQVTDNGRLTLHVVAYGSQTRVDFSDVEGQGQVLLDFHSHNRMSAFFSLTDDADEQQLRWYGVVGDLHKRRPVYRLRLGVYGYHFPMPLSVLFDYTGDYQDGFHLDRKALSRPASRDEKHSHQSRRRWWHRFGVGD